MNKSNISNVIEKIKTEVRENIDFHKAIRDDEILNLITNLVFDQSYKEYLTMQEKQDIIDSIFNSIRRLDVLQPLLEDEKVTEIMINGPKEIFVEVEGKVSKIDACFESKEKLEDVIQSVVSKVNRTVNEASPIADARLADGSRVNVVLPPVALNGPILTIRKFNNKTLTMEKLIEMGTLTEEVAAFLEVLVKSKHNIFICGGTGSGKTTLLNQISQFIPQDERVITIEDSAELQLNSIDNLVRLETRNANSEGKGEITIRELIKSSLRMRPERVIVGEVRGAEALDMLQAMNTGHDGSISTGHANSCMDMISRLETMVLCGAVLPLEAIRQQIASAIDIMVHISRMRDRSRRILEIAEVLGYENGTVHLNPLFQFKESDESSGVQLIGELCSTGNELKNNNKLVMSGYKLTSEVKNID